MQSIGTRGPRWIAVLLAAAVFGTVAGVGLMPTPASAQTTTVSLQKRLVDANNQPITGGQLAGYSFTITNFGTGFTQTQVSNATGVVVFTGVGPGTYSISEAPITGATLVGFFDTNGAALANNQFTVAAVPTPVGLSAVNRVAGTSSITIQKQIVDGNGNVLTGQVLSGYGFAIAGPSGTPQTVTTNATGQATLTNLAAGSYTILETPASGFQLSALTINGVPVSNLTSAAPFTLAAGQTATIIASNRAGSASGNVTITKNIVDQNGAFLASGDRSNFSFTFASGATTTSAGPTNTSGSATVTLAAGNYTFNETVRSGCTFRDATFNGATLRQGDTITISASGTNAIIVNNTCTGTTPGGQTRVDQLFPGCNNVAITSPAGTPLTTVAAGVSPASSLNSIFRYNNATGTFSGFNPSAPAFANDYNTVGVRFEPVFVCVSGAGQFTQPAA